MFEIKYVKEFKELCRKFSVKANNHEFDGIYIGQHCEPDIQNICYLFITRDLIEISFNDEIYIMHLNGNNRLGAYRYLKILICCGPIYFFTPSKQDGPYTYYKYESKLKLIREFLL